MPTRDDLALAQYNKDANAILAKHGKTFYWARFFLSKDAAQKATRLYRFCRYIDDLADEAIDQNQAKNVLGDVIKSLEQSSASDPVIADAIALFAACEIPIEVPIALIRGVMSDLTIVRLKTEAELLKYCYQVAGTVGIMMCRVLGVSDSKALYHAIDLGIAMQLTNICRDVHADAVMNRIYLPRAIFGLDSTARIITLDEESHKKLIESLNLLLKQADTYYASAYSGLCFLPFRSRVSILIAARLYQKIGDQMQKKSFANWGDKAYVPLPLKLLTSLQACCKALIDPQFWVYQHTHNAQLHYRITPLPFCNSQAQSVSRNHE